MSEQRADTTIEHPGARQWSPRKGKLGAILVILLPLALLVLGWSMRGLPDLPMPQLRPGKLPDAHWEAKAALQTPRADAGLVAVGTQLWVLGGRGPDGPLATSEQYLATADQWRPGPALATPRSQPAVVTAGETIYLIGGLGPGQTPVASVEALDTRTNQLRTVAPLPVPLANAAAVLVGDALYLVGGQGATGPVNTVYRYTLATNTWQAVAPLANPRTALGAVLFDNRIYAIGGLVQGAPSASVEIYDPATNSWAVGPQMLAPVDQVAAVTYNGRIHVLGYEAQQVYDPRAAKWVTASPVSVRRDHEAAAVLVDKLYAVGGADLGTGQPLQQVEAYQLGEAETPDTFVLWGFSPGGALALIAGLTLTFSLMAIMLRVGRRRTQPEETPLPDDE